MSSVKEFKPCPGRHRVNDNRLWYIPSGETGSTCTYCEECFNLYVVPTTEDITSYKIINGGQLVNCNCDYPKDLNKCSITKESIRVTVFDTKSFKTFDILENSVANLNGVMHVALPTCTEYAILIENLNNSDPNLYFSFEPSSKVGDKPIVINDGRTIFYKKDLEVKGFKTGTNDSFMFISLSDQEKSSGKTLSGENVTNVISLKVKKYRRELNRHANFFGSSLETYKRRGPFLNVPFIDLGMDTQYTLQCKGTLTIENQRGGTGSSNVINCGNGFRGGEKGISVADEECCDEACADEMFENQTKTIKVEEPSSVTGGATVSGGKRVNDIATTSSSDKFIPEGETIEFLIQLVCTQEDNEKFEANKAYQTEKELSERRVLLSKRKRIEADQTYNEEKVEYHKEQVSKCKKDLEDIDKELEAYAHLRSPNPQDYLLKFNF